MALRNILKVGDTGLTKKSREVTDFNKRLHVLIDDMRETIIDAGGLGLAAPQVGVLRRVALIMDVPEEPENDDDELNEETSAQDNDTDNRYSEEYIVELVNPEIITRQGEQEGSEGCLSNPGRYGMVRRPKYVKIRAQDRFGRSFEYEGRNMTARAICHEIDHLEGIMFMSKADRMLTDEELEEMRNTK